MDLSRRNEGIEGRNCCEYGSCRKPVFQPRSKFCGLLHRDSFMADMFDRLKVNVSVGGIIAQPLQSLRKCGVCSLPGCENATFFDSSTGQTHDFCRRGHSHQYMELKTRQWKEEGRLCQLVDCTSHVHVENGSRVHNFCSLKHAAMAARARGLSPVAVPAVEKKPQRGYNQLSNKKLKEIVKELQESLRADPTDGRALDGGAFQNFEMKVDIFKNHPHEIVDANKKMAGRWFLTRSLGDDSQGSHQLTTKEGFHWKQSSKPEGGSLYKRYYTYENTKPEKEPCQDDGNGAWRLHRITVKSEESRCRFVISKIFQSEKRKGKARNEDVSLVASAENRELSDSPHQAPELANPLSSRAASPVHLRRFQDSAGPDHSPDEMQRASEDRYVLSRTSSSDPQIHAGANPECKEIAMEEVPDLELNFVRNEIAPGPISRDDHSQFSLGHSDDQSTQSVQEQQHISLSPRDSVSQTHDLDQLDYFLTSDPLNMWNQHENQHYLNLGASVYDHPMEADESEYVDDLWSGSL